MSVIYLKDAAPNVGQRTPKEALEEAINMLKADGFEAKEVLTIMFDGDAEHYCYRFVQGGAMSRADMLWHLQQMQFALLDGRIGRE